MNITISRRRRVGLAAATVASVAALALVPAFAANAAIVPTVGSAHPVYLLSADDGSQVPAGTALSWGVNVNGSTLASDPDFTSKFAIPAGATAVKTFISPRTQESTVSAWNASGNLALTAGGIQIPNLKPSNNTIVGSGTPAGSSAVANVGGDYSLGIAFLNGNAVVEVDYTYITVAANPTASLATWTFATPAAAATAPAITTQPTNTSVNPGATATFTAAASGSPAPTVQWQSAASGSSTFTDISGATSASLSVPNVTAAQAGTQYKAVFTNSAGAATTNVATLSVAKTAPDLPTSATPNKVTIADPAKGATTVVLPLGSTNANKTFQVFAWSDPTNLGQKTADATGNLIVDISTLPAGAHTVALTQPGDATFSVLAWTTFTKASATGDPISKDVNLTATVTASDLWSLDAANTAVDFGNVTRGTTVTRDLGKVTVVDDRNVLKGWSLDTTWTKFTSGANEIPTSALAIGGKFFAGYTPIPGIEIGTATNLAKSSAVSTTPTGALIDASLAFTAPGTAQAGVYHSTLTLTLTSK